MKLPPSLNDLLEKREKDEKPKFLTKEERSKIALEKRQHQVDAQKALLEQRKLDNLAFLETAKQTTKTRSNDRYNRNERNTSDRFNRSNDRQPSSHSSKYLPPPPPEQKLPTPDDVQLSEKEKEAIKKKYMGLDTKKRKIRKMNDKKFVFDWNNEEDTSRDINPLYDQKHATLLLGRGHIAGIDIKEQANKAKQFYDPFLNDRRTEIDVERAIVFAEQDARREQKIAWDDRHWSEKPLEKMKDRDWRIFKEDFNISTKGGHMPNPLRNWKEADISQSLKDTISKVGYKEPTPIQRQAIPIGLANRDIIGIAETGSGKTASFLIPMLEFILQLPPLNETNQHDGPYALILAPTRELAQQIEQETLKFCTPLGFICVSFVGGHSIGDQSFNLRNGAHVIIATPGRLKDAIDRHMVVLNQCTYVVMDEADRMIDMGFEEDVNFILDSLPVSNIKPDGEEAEYIKDMQKNTGINKIYRQTVMFSATMPTTVEKLAQKYLRRPAVVTIGQAGQAVSRIEQRVEYLSDETRKIQRMLDIVGSKEFARPMIVFVNLKKSCDYLARALEKQGHRTTTLHGGKSQDQREFSLHGLKDGSKDILVATDVAGRGIDIKNVSLVLNFDMAKNIEDYTHRIGRTGRAGSKGCAISFITNSDSEVFYDLKQMLQKSNMNIPRELMQHEAANTKPGTIAPKRKFED